jgi:hypothetical protein
MFHRGQLTTLGPEHAGMNYSKFLETPCDTNGSPHRVEVMTRRVLISRQHFPPVIESIAGGKNRLTKKFKNFRSCY